MLVLKLRQLSVTVVSCPPALKLGTSTSTTELDSLFSVLEAVNGTTPRATCRYKELICKVSEIPRAFRGVKCTKMPGGRKELMEYLENLGITSETVEHPAVYTVEAMLPYVGHLSGAHSKNLFLKDKKKKRLWLLTAIASRDVNLNDLAKKVGASGGFRFAEESLMLEKLGVGQGCVTPLSLFNDTQNEVTFLLDASFVEDKYERLHFHPMSNEATTGLNPEDFLKFVKATGHEPIIVHF